MGPARCRAFAEKKIEWPDKIRCADSNPGASRTQNFYICLLDAWLAE